MLELADFIARHAVAVLLLIACLGLILTALFWHLVTIFGDGAWRAAVRAWNFVRGTALARKLKGVPLVGPFFKRTLTATRYLGLYAVVAFVISIGAIAAFFSVADEIGFDEELAQFDVALAAALDQHLSNETLYTFSLITHLGDRDTLMVLAALVAVSLLIARRWVLAAAWVAATAGGGLLNLLLKGIFERPRPLHEHGFAYETSFSFPSGHASGSMLIYSLLGYLIVRHTPRTSHIPVAIITVAVIVFVGSSRVLLQVHYFTDVLAGYASAAAWSAMCIAGLETVRWRGEFRAEEPQKNAKKK
jgi:membrane-associated phospholipid phosphatase